MSISAVGFRHSKFGQAPGALFQIFIGSFQCEEKGFENPLITMVKIA